MTVSRLQHATRFHVPRLPGADYRNRVNERLFVTLSSYYQTKNQWGDHWRSAAKKIDHVPASAEGAILRLVPAPTSVIEVGQEDPPMH